jgi:preprotein translocase subunit SecB
MKLTIAQMLLEEAKFAHRGDFLSLPASASPSESKVEMAVELSRAEDFSTAVVRLKVSTSADASAPYNFSVSYLALIKLDVEEGEATTADIDRRLMVTGASMLYPFVREIVANLTTRGRFGPSWLSPTDFNKVVSRMPTPVPATANATTD